MIFHLDYCKKLLISILALRCPPITLAYCQHSSQRDSIRCKSDHIIFLLKPSIGFALSLSIKAEVFLMVCKALHDCSSRCGPQTSAGPQDNYKIESKSLETKSSSISWFWWFAFMFLYVFFHFLFLISSFLLYFIIGLVCEVWGEKHTLSPLAVWKVLLHMLWFYFSTSFPNCFPTSSVHSILLAVP